MLDRKKALIAGATGVVGRNLLRHLLTLDDWDVIAVSRRKPDVEGRYEHVAVDLLDRAQTFEALKRPRGVTHVFFSAYIERPTWSEMVAPNQTMLVNLMDVVETASPDLAHVNLMHGTKWYGNHLGPFKTPAKEDDPRHMPPNFYYNQQDLDLVNGSTTCDLRVRDGQSDEPRHGSCRLRRYLQGARNAPSTPGHTGELPRSLSMHGHGVALESSGLDGDR